MLPNDHARCVMLPHLLDLIAQDRDYAERAIRDYFDLCPWAKALIGPQLRAAWKE